MVAQFDEQDKPCLPMFITVSNETGPIRPAPGGESGHEILMPITLSLHSLYKYSTTCTLNILLREYASSLHKSTGLRTPRRQSPGHIYSLEKSAQYYDPVFCINRILACEKHHETSCSSWSPGQYLISGHHWNSNDAIRHKIILRHYFPVILFKHCLDLSDPASDKSPWIL